MTPKNKRETIGSLMQSLGAFVILAVSWVVLDLIANATGIGLLSGVAAILFLVALLAMTAVLFFAGSLLKA